MMLCRWHSLTLCSKDTITMCCGLIVMACWWHSATMCSLHTITLCYRHVVTLCSRTMLR